MFRREETDTGLCRRNRLGSLPGICMANGSRTRFGWPWLPALAIGLSMLGAVWAAARGWFTGSGRGAGGHWPAVAAGRAALARGRPDQALEAVNLVRDEAPG